MFSHRPRSLSVRRSLDDAGWPSEASVTISGTIQSGCVSNPSSSRTLAAWLRHAIRNSSNL
jgi:hypothetical protein